MVIDQFQVGIGAAEQIAQTGAALVGVQDLVQRLRPVGVGGVEALEYFLDAAAPGRALVVRSRQPSARDRVSAASSTAPGS